MTIRINRVMAGSMEISVKLENFAFRADAGSRIGSGHLMRCLVLADALKQAGARVFFITRGLSSGYYSLIHSHGHVVCRLPLAKKRTDDKVDATQTGMIIQKIGADCLIVDSYALDIRWESLLRPFVKKIMVIDDLADRPHDCDILLDQNYYKNMGRRYSKLVPKHCKKFLGQEYVLLRKEFFEARKKLKQRDGKVKRVLIFFGGSDYANETTKVLRAVRSLEDRKFFIEVVIGAINKNKTMIRRSVLDMRRIKLYSHVKSFSELLANSDLFIGAGGVTTWERCFLALPSIVITIADNQVEMIKNLAAKGAVSYLGHYDKVSETDIGSVLKKAVNDPQWLKKISRAANTLMRSAKGQGMDRLVKTLINFDGLNAN